MLNKRASGLLLHVTSLPSEYGIGDFGPGARRFADFLDRAGMRFWQILPLNLTMAKQGFSPYNCFSAFAGNPLLISPEELVKDRLLKRSEISSPPSFSVEKIDFTTCDRYKSALFKLAFKRFQARPVSSQYRKFLNENKPWLEDFALFMALRGKYRGKIWSAWPKDLKYRKPEALAQSREELADSIDYHRFLQYLFSKQYFSLKRYCNDRGIKLFGDLPIYVTYDSADVWADPQCFKLDRSRKPKFIAGVPPDYFSKTGQLWGNPVYDWKHQAEDDYAWWMRRIRHNFKLYDWVRMDHFRGFEAYWQVPAGHTTAVKGRWVKGPGEAFFRQLLDHTQQAPIIVEDLGDITPAVRELIAQFAFPTMKVLHFAFDGNYKTNVHLPHNHAENAVVYTGTHDNNTTRGWYRKDLTTKQKKLLTSYTGKRLSEKEIHWDMIQMAMASVANLSIIPMQDVLGLDEKSRMNNPAKTRNNWRWRMKPGQLKASLAMQLRKRVEQYGRL